MKLILPKACNMFGASMGRLTRLPQDVNAPIKLHMEKLNWIDLDYDKSGAYWGYTPETNMYCAWSEFEPVQVFVRASSRRDAKCLVRQLVTSARFFN